jgi:hypothetical protein
MTRTVGEKLRVEDELIGAGAGHPGKMVGKDARVLVVAKTDAALLAAAGENAAPFPQGEDGSHLGYLPGDSAAAIEMLNAARRRGATHLLFPHTSFWWFDHYEGVPAALGLEHNCLWRDDGLALFGLAPLAENVEVVSSGSASADELAYWRQTPSSARSASSSSSRRASRSGVAPKCRPALAGEDGKPPKSVADLPYRPRPHRPVRGRPADLRRRRLALRHDRHGRRGQESDETASAGSKAISFHLLPLVMTGMKQHWDALQKFENPDQRPAGAGSLRLLRRAQSHRRAVQQALRRAEPPRPASRAGSTQTPEPGTIFAVPLLSPHVPARDVHLHAPQPDQAHALVPAKVQGSTPKRTMEMGILSWKACMDAWSQVRTLLRPGSFAEFRQDDLTGKTDEVVARLATLLDMTPTSRQLRAIISSASVRSSPAAAPTRRS